LRHEIWPEWWRWGGVEAGYVKKVVSTRLGQDVKKSRKGGFPGICLE